MVGDSANALGFSAQTIDRSSQIFVEAALPIGVNHWFAVFRGEYQVVVKAQVGGHVSGVVDLLASFQDAWICILDRGCRFAQPRLMAFKPSACRSYESWASAEVL